MESGNSSSLHSSSEADDEYDSRSTDVALSTILSASPFPPPPLPPSPANFLDPMGSLPSPTWTSLRPLRPPHQDPPSCTQLPMTQHPPPTPPPSSSNPAAPPRGSRKRARASRRAPTTVLTTDTTNFRQMVQEFTGIPSPPFPSFARPRLDLLHAAAAASSSIRLGLLDPSNILRPLAHKPATPPPPPPPPPLTSTTTFLPSPPTVTATPATTSSSPVTAIDSYRLLPMQQQQQRQSTPVFTFQSLLEKGVSGTQETGNLTSGVTTALVASASSSGYVEQKGPEIAPSTTQGTVESSWIFSLDQ